MWMLLIVFVAAIVGLVPRLTERQARLAVLPLVLVVVSYQALTSGLL